MADIDSISESAPIDIEVLAPQGPAGPNAVTSATTSDGTAVMTFASVGSPIIKATTSAGVSAKTNGGVTCFSWGAGNGQNFTFTAGTGVLFNSTSFTFGAGAASAFKNALNIAEGYVLLTDADLVEVHGYQGFNLTQQGVYVVTGAVTSAWEGQIVIPASADGQYTLINQSAIYGSVYDDNNNEIADFDIGKRVTLIFAELYWQYSISTPNTQAICEAKTNNSDGRPSELHDGGITGTLTFNTTSYVYTTGAAAAHRTALGLGTLATQDANATTLSGTLTINATSYAYGTGAGTRFQAALVNASGIGNVYCYDDFIGSSASSGGIGELGWSVAGTATIQGNEPRHPGIMRVSSATTGAMYLNYLATVGGTNAFDGLSFEAALRLADVASCQCLFGISYVNSYLTNGFRGLAYDSSVSPNWQLLHRTQAGANTFTDTGKAAVNNDWIKVKLTFANGLTTCEICTTTSPVAATVTNAGAYTATTLAHCPQYTIKALSGTKTIDVDAFLIHGTTTRL